MPKIVLPSSHIISAQSMVSNVTSAAQDIRNVDNVGIMLAFTGTPTGTFAVDLSTDGSTNWTALSLSPTPVASGAANTVYLDLNQISAPYIRVRYVATSGTGTLDAYITGKSMS